jgi:hypothetical protein
MGHFLAVTGFRSESVTDVAAAITDYLSSFGVPSESVPAGSPLNDRRDAEIYAPVNGWTVVLWPQYFNIHDFPLARAVAAARSWLVSTVHVYDSDYWEHLCCSGGVELHAFCSRPHFWQDDAPEDFQSMMAYATEPSRLASALGVSPQVIQPYLADVDALPDPEAKAQADDEFALEDIWVLVDFWRRLGIAYPAPPQNRAAVLRLGLNVRKKLPAG